MLQVILFILSVTLATVNGWGVCYEDSWANFSTSQCVVSSCYECNSVPNARGGCSLTRDAYSPRCLNFSGNPNSNNVVIGCRTNNLNFQYKQIRCSSKCEADSLICNQVQGTWHGGENCYCDTTHCQPFDTTMTQKQCFYDASQGKYLVTQITRQCHIDTCSGVNQATCSGDTTSYYSVTCDTSCTEDSEITCLGSIDGVNVYLRGCNGRVTKCAADGSCDFAMQKVALGECENPNDPPNGGSSDSQGSSSSQGGNSSGGGDLDWLKDSLRVIHETNRDGFEDVNNNLENIQPFVAGTYDQVTDIAGTVHDINSNLLTGFEFLNDIKENTGNTANNTYNINTKLNNTNSLLESINQKNWHTTVNVSPPEVTVQGDTNIINVSGDTAKSGFEILNFLKRIFGGDTTSNVNPSDTVGLKDSTSRMVDRILQGTDSVPNMSDSIGVAVQGFGSAYRQLADSINAYTADSIASWNNQLLNNGVLTGNGSDNCPSVLNSPISLDIGPVHSTTSITLGYWLCRPVLGTGITWWGLARVLLRMILSITCMWWLYREVTGVGGSNEED